MLGRLLCLTGLIWVAESVGDLVVKQGRATSDQVMMTSVIDADFGEIYDNFTLPGGQITVYRYAIHTNNVARVSLRVFNLTKPVPLLGVIRGQQAVRSVQLPFRVTDKQNGLYLYDRVALTMCPYAEELYGYPSNSISDNDTDLGYMFVELSSSNQFPVHYTLLTTLVNDIRLKINENVTTWATPSEPVVFAFTFPDNVSSVVVHLQSDDSICATVSVQPIQCPISDMESNIAFTGMHQSMTRLAALPVTKDVFSQFYLVVIIKPCDYECNEGMSCVTSSKIIQTSRRKQLRLIVEEVTLSQWYLVPLALTASVVAVIFLIAFALVQFVESRQYREWMVTLNSEAGAGSGYTPIDEEPEPQIGTMERSGQSGGADSPIDLLAAVANEEFILAVDPPSSVMRVVIVPNSCGTPEVAYQTIGGSRHSLLSPSLRSSRYGTAREELSDGLSFRTTSDATLHSSANYDPAQPGPEFHPSALPDARDRYQFVQPSFHREPSTPSSNSSEIYRNPRMGREPSLNMPSSAARRQRNDTDDTGTIVPSTTDRSNTLVADSGMGDSASVTTDGHNTIVHRILGDRNPNEESEIIAEYDMVDDADTNKHVARIKKALYVSDLSLKSHKQRDKKYRLYLWNLLTISMFYALPVVQLVFIWLDTTRTSGNQDLCYYNYLCARPFLGFSAFNNIISNVGYVALGLLFVLLVGARDARRRYFKHLIERSGRQPPELGLPPHYGLLYSIGFAIMMEGILSAAYHVCPSSQNYQFDTSFMYIIGCLGMLKVYQLRHPDINANAHVAYGVMACIILLCMCGVYFRNLLFWLTFSIFYGLLIISITIEFYYKGEWKLHNAAAIRQFRASWSNALRRCCLPMYPGRLLFLVVVNAVNWLLLVLGVVHRPRDFPSYLLAIVIANLMLYTCYYLGMKLRCGERILIRPLVTILAATAGWAGSIYLFLQHENDWSRTPSQSRELNHECILFDFYDYHDCWHFTSAISLFLSFMVIMCVDDDLANTPRHKIRVF